MISRSSTSRRTKGRNNKLINTSRSCVRLLKFGLMSLLLIGLVSFRRAQIRLETTEEPNKATILESNASKEKKTPCEKAVEHLVDLGIRLVALDFDSTIVDIHTGGHWRSSADELALHVRPEMRCLIQTSMIKGLLPAVTSFSSQEELMKEVMTKAIPPQMTMMMTKNTTVLVVMGGSNQSEPEGKRKQLEGAIDSYQKMMTSPPPRPSTTILIDDDNYNIRTAVDDGYYAIRFNPRNAGSLFDKILALKPR